MRTWGYIGWIGAVADATGVILQKRMSFLLSSNISIPFEFHKPGNLPGLLTIVARPGPSRVRNRAIENWNIGNENDEDGKEYQCSS
jgi:hypothetical protein